MMHRDCFAKDYAIRIDTDVVMMQHNDSGDSSANDLLGDVNNGNFDSFRWLDAPLLS